MSKLRLGLCGASLTLSSSDKELEREERVDQPSRDIIRQRIDEGPVVPTMVLIIGVGFLLNLVDGFDVVAMSVAGPSISADWGISDVEKGWILSSALVGMAIGAAALAPL
ncbi:MAG: hypothetical protein MI723_12285, partial [Caulobacterales bacterium]|nr:hypothetical protein [Caulobacterales bacterium]